MESRQKMRTGWLLLVAIGAILGWPSGALATTFCQSTYRRLFYTVAQAPQRIFRDEIRFTGYASSAEVGGPEWTPQLFRSVVEKGITSPLVRSIAKVNGISQAEALARVAYLREAPPEILDTLAMLHKWEALHGISPFVSSSRSKSVAASFGPFPRANRKSNAVLFAFGSRAGNELKVSTSRGLRIWKLLSEISRKNSKEELTKLPASQRALAMKLWDWLDRHGWMRELTLPYYLAETRPDWFAAELAKDPSQEFGRLFHTKHPGTGNIVLMNMLEDESLSLLQVPPEAIVSGSLFNESGKLVEKYSKKAKP